MLDFLYSGLRSTILLFILLAYAQVSIGFLKDPRSQFYKHATIKPRFFPQVREKRDLLNSVKVRNEEKLTIGFEAFDKNFILELKMNKDLLPIDYFEKHHDGNGYLTHMPMKEDPSHCHYQGHMPGIKDSFAALSTCDGVSGIVFDGHELHYIQPDVEYPKDKHLIFRESDLIPQNLSCGFESSMKYPGEHFLPQLQRSKRSTVLQDPFKSDRQTRYVELVIVNDNKQFKEFKGNEKVVFERSKQIANIVNGLYQPLNIFIALTGVIIWSKHDEINLSPDGDATLTNFLHYRRERLAQEHPNDNAQLITGMAFDSGVVGKALKGPICTLAYSGGVSMDHSHLVGLVATTMSHEIGHNFGMEHDSDTCLCPTEKCIMAPSSSSSTSPRHWSSCSLEYLEMAYAHGMDYCLKNRPLSIIGPECGNGFLENGEQCDCGLKEFCTNPCCNASSCQLFSNATCATGSCCDINTCQVKKTATICRDSISDCDLPEFCDGHTEFCPADTHLQNGELCKSGKAFCYEGKCQSHSDQCLLLWGQTGKSADRKCYEQNFKGNVNGNCGYNRINQTYKACRKDDIMCGMLHCSHLNERLEYGLESAAILSKSYIQTKDKTLICRSAIIDLGLYNTDPGLVPDGAACDNGKACLNQKCVPVSSMKKECPYKCNNKGVCNDKGHCHCYLGYAPPFCDSPGAGGSIDSGPVSDTTNHFIEALMYVVFFGLLPLIILTASAIYYYRSHLKTWWLKKAHKAAIKSRTKTVVQSKIQPPSKFNFDRHSLHTLEISAPIQMPSHSTNAISSNCILDNTVNSYMIQSQGSAIKYDKNIPVRPAPPKPNLVHEPVPPWTPVARIISPKMQSSSFKCDGVNMQSRPNCPPPRPPPPQNLTKQDCNSTFSGSPKLNENNSINVSFYDDCQTLDFSNTALAFVHKQDNNVKKFHNTGVSLCKMNNNTVPKASHVNKISNFDVNNKPVDNYPKNKSSRLKINENSLVASLAQKFEKSNVKKNDIPLDTSLRPPFKSRPLPTRPDRSNV